MYYATVCSVFRRENLWLREFVDHNRKIGIEHLYLINDDDSRTRKEAVRILAPYISEGYVTLYENGSEEKRKWPVEIYRDIARQHEKDCFWMGFIDLDEYILPKKTDDFRETLGNYEVFDALAINWHIFGTSGHVDFPESQIHHLLYRAEDDFQENRYVKSFVQPKYLDLGKVVDPHFFKTTRNATVDSYFRKIDTSWPNFCSHDIAVINHYMLRCEKWYYQVKMQRRRFSMIPHGDDFFNYHNRNEIYDDEIALRFGK